MQDHFLPSLAKAEALAALIREEGMRAYILKLADDRYLVREFF